MRKLALNQYTQLQQIDYSPKPEAVQRVREEIENYQNITGNLPELIILGFGTYFALCLIETQIQLGLAGGTGSGVLYLWEYHGIRIIVDPTCEYRATATNKDPEDTAIWALSLSKRAKSTT